MLNFFEEHFKSVKGYFYLEKRHRGEVHPWRVVAHLTGNDTCRREGGVTLKWHNVRNHLCLIAFIMNAVSTATLR